MRIVFKPGRPVYFIPIFWGTVLIGRALLTHLVPAPTPDHPWKGHDGQLAGFLTLLAILIVALSWVAVGPRVSLQRAEVINETKNES
jgi:hypothetical protein